MVSLKVKTIQEKRLLKTALRIVRDSAKVGPWMEDVIFPSKDPKKRAAALRKFHREKKLCEKQLAMANGLLRQLDSLKF